MSINTQYYARMNVLTELKSGIMNLLNNNREALSCKWFSQARRNTWQCFFFLSVVRRGGFMQVSFYLLVSISWDNNAGKQPFFTSHKVKQIEYASILCMSLIRDRQIYCCEVNEIKQVKINYLCHQLFKISLVLRFYLDIFFSMFKLKLLGFFFAGLQWLSLIIFFYFFCFNEYRKGRNRHTLHSIVF